MRVSIYLKRVPILLERHPIEGCTIWEEATVDCIIRNLLIVVALYSLVFKVYNLGMEPVLLAVVDTNPYVTVEAA